ncbi:hypothetical protein SAMN05216548_12711 [Faunimonas pinastri]|uniref:Ribbon-helix-helix protein CopG domain-containing protein n=1 Tax=Faunimonas pinastri TaxID=1855383 RepID=A0A1H9QCW2_9HYPH|nr:hypothetical protein [Faunimonas pinastri]SER58314.1 hypothetical protein SAMN05216548_12711 [Faunimonas pinastri]
MSQPHHHLYFIDRLNVSVPSDFREAVRAAAEGRGITMSDYAREAVAERLQREGVTCASLPAVNALTAFRKAIAPGRAR